MPRIIPPPDVWPLFHKSSRKILEAIQDPVVAAYVQKHNNAYTPWGKLKRMPAPRELSAEQAWACIKLSRSQQYRELPFSDTSGCPFRYWLPDSVLELLHRIDQQAAGTMASQSELLPDAHENERYLITSLMEEAIASSILEGAVTTRVEAKRMLKQGRRPRTKPEHMIANNYSAIRHISRIQNRPLDLDILNELHRIVTQNTVADNEAGRFQQSGEKRVGVMTIQDGEVVHLPPPADESLRRMATIVRFANDEHPKRFHHPVVRAILLHFAVAYVHPYVDGNGRTARAVFYWSMLHQDYWLAQYMAVSSIIRKAPMQYYSAFKHSELDEGDVTYFILYHLRVIDKAISAFHKYVHRKREELKATTRMLGEYPALNYRQRALLSHAIRNPDAYYTFDSHAGSHKVSYYTGRSDLRQLTGLGLLREIYGRPIRFVPAPDLQKTISKADY